MITLINPQTRKVLSFKNYDQLFTQITNFESLMRFPDTPEDIKGWGFHRHTYDRILAFSHYVAKTRGRLKAYDVLEITWGASREPLILALTPSVDQASLKKDWCRAYCQAHGFTIEDGDDLLALVKGKAPEKGDKG